MNYFLSISSAILNYQPISQMINYLTVNNANILFNANVSISSSIGSFNQYITNNNLNIISLSSLIYTNNNAVINYELNNNLYNTSLSSLIYTNNNAIINYELNNNLYNTSLLH